MPDYKILAGSSFPPVILDLNSDHCSSLLPSPHPSQHLYPWSGERNQGSNCRQLSTLSQRHQFLPTDLGHQPSTLLSRQSQHASAGGKVSFLSPGWALVSPLHDSQLSNIYHSMCQVKILISSGKGWIKYKRTKQNTATVRGQQTYSLCLWINIFWWLLLCNEGRVE